MPTVNNQSMTGIDATLDAVMDDQALMNDIVCQVKRYVKEDLYRRVIAVFDDDQMAQGSFLHRDYMSKCEDIIGRTVHPESPTTKPTKALMNYVWMNVSKEKLYYKWLCVKRSNSYQSVQDKFYSKCTL